MFRLLTGIIAFWQAALFGSTHTQFACSQLLANPWRNWAFVAVHEPLSAGLHTPPTYTANNRELSVPILDRNSSVVSLGGELEFALVKSLENLSISYRAHHNWGGSLPSDLIYWQETGSHLRTSQRMVSEERVATRTRHVQVAVQVERIVAGAATIETRYELVPQEEIYHYTVQVPITVRDEESLAPAGAFLIFPNPFEGEAAEWPSLLRPAFNLLKVGGTIRFAQVFDVPSPAKGETQTFDGHNDNWFTFSLQHDSPLKKSWEGIWGS